MPTERRPNLFIVGAQKSGTSALSAMLGRHPQVLMSFPKEPGYLAFGPQGYPYLDGYGNPARAKEWVITDRARYAALFSAATDHHRILGEASTWYFAIPGIAQRIKTFNPDSRIVVSLRDPAERAYSAWCHARRDQLEPCEDFSQALEMEERRGEVEYLLRYHFMGQYSERLAEYRSVFGEDQLLVLFYQDFRANPDVVWTRLCEFLDIDDSLPVPPRQDINRSGQPRSARLQKLMASHRLRAFARALLPMPLLVRMKNRVDDINLQPFAPMDAEIRRQLQEYYREDVMALSELTGRDLQSWLPG